jgi:hypothetical protein
MVASYFFTIVQAHPMKQRQENEFTYQDQKQDGHYTPKTLLILQEYLIKYEFAKFLEIDPQHKCSNARGAYFFYKECFIT